MSPFKSKFSLSDSRTGTQSLTKVEDINKRWQEYTEELYKKDVHDPDNQYDVITHLEPDILECEVKQAFCLEWEAGYTVVMAEQVLEAKISPPRELTLS